MHSELKSYGLVLTCFEEL